MFFTVSVRLFCSPLLKGMIDAGSSLDEITAGLVTLAKAFSLRKTVELNLDDIVGS